MASHENMDTVVINFKNTEDTNIVDVKKVIGGSSDSGATESEYELDSDISLESGLVGNVATRDLDTQKECLFSHVEAWLDSIRDRFYADEFSSVGSSPVSSSHSPSPRSSSSPWSSSSEAQAQEEEEDLLETDSDTEETLSVDMNEGTWGYSLAHYQDLPPVDSQGRPITPPLTKEEIDADFEEIRKGIRRNEFFRSKDNRHKHSYLYTLNHNKKRVKSDDLFDYQYEEDQEAALPTKMFKALRRPRSSLLR